VGPADAFEDGGGDALNDAGARSHSKTAGGREKGEKKESESKDSGELNMKRGGGNRQVRS